MVERKSYLDWRWMRWWCGPGGARRRGSIHLNGRRKMLVVRCSLAGAITHLKRDCETALVSVQYLFSHSSRQLLSLCWLPSASPSADTSTGSKEESWPVWALNLNGTYFLGQVAATEVIHRDFYTFIYMHRLWSTLTGDLQKNISKLRLQFEQIHTFLWSMWLNVFQVI